MPHIADLSRHALEQLLRTGIAERVLDWLGFIEARERREDPKEPRVLHGLSILLLLFFLGLFALGTDLREKRLAYAALDPQRVQALCGVGRRGGGARCGKRLPDHLLHLFHLIIVAFF